MCALKEEFRYKIHGMQRFSTLLFQNTEKNLEELYLSDYEELNNEPLTLFPTIFRILIENFPITLQKISRSLWKK